MKAPRSGGLVALVLLLLFVRPAHADSEAPPASADVGVDERLGASLPLDEALVSPGGAQLRLGDTFLPGEPVVLVLAYSDCPMLCNLVLRGLASAVRGTRARPGEDFQLVTVSIDPDESPEVAAATQRSLVAAAGYPGESSRWRYLLASDDASAAVAAAVGFRYRYDPRTEQWAHPAVVIVVTPEGLVSQYLYGLKIQPDELDEAIALARSGEQRANAAIRNAATCFRFDPAATKYAGPLRLALRLTGVFAIGGVVTAVALAMRRWRAA